MAEAQFRVGALDDDFSWSLFRIADWRGQLWSGTRRASKVDFLLDPLRSRSTRRRMRTVLIALEMTLRLVEGTYEDQDGQDMVEHDSHRDCRVSSCATA